MSDDAKTLKIALLGCGSVGIWIVAWTELAVGGS